MELCLTTYVEHNSSTCSGPMWNSLYPACNYVAFWVEEIPHRATVCERIVFNINGEKGKHEVVALLFEAVAVAQRAARARAATADMELKVEDSYVHTVF